MIVLDENIPRNQRELLISWRIPARQIGVDTERKGIQDDEIIPLLQKMRRPTFFTRDSDFFRRQFCHSRYCLVFMDINRYEVALFARRLLRHPQFDTQAKRMGQVVRLSMKGIGTYRLHNTELESVDWSV